MDRTDEVIYLAGVPGIPRVIPWIKFSLKVGVLNPQVKINITAFPKTALVG
jgi:hypothetical protein